MKLSTPIYSVVIICLLAGAVFAFGGIKNREDRLMDPYSRSKYFGEGYKKPLIGYGQQNAPKGSFGRRDFHGGRDKFTVSIIPQGRNPGRVSHFDAGYRGYKMMDKIVDLEPYGAYERLNLETAPPRVKARIFSSELNPGSPSTKLPKSRVLISASNLPALADYEAYEVWISDEDSGFSFSLGFLRPGLRSGANLAELSNVGGIGGLLEHDGAFNLFEYDSIFITKEPVYDTDPRPGEIIMWGDINKKTWKNEPWREND